MKKFLVLYHAPISPSQQLAKATREQVKAGMEAWLQWAKTAAGAILDLGSPLNNGQSLVSGTVGNSGSTVVGYSLLRAESMDIVINLLQDHPHPRMTGFYIEVFETMPMPGM